jgi:CRP/FNR family transcriptional regulator, cyclic AMP receptor protein
MARSHPNDALNYLPRRSLIEYEKGETIYAGRSENLYLVAGGRVKVSIIEGPAEAIVRLVPPKRLFGESAIVGAQTQEHAQALDKVQLMAWSRLEIEQQIEKEPRLGLAIMEELILDRLEMQERIHAMAVCKTPQRVKLSLLQLAECLGDRLPNGALAMPALTHHIIAAHVGTSREIVSTQMSRLRRLGMLRYSRKFIEVEGDAMREALRNEGFRLSNDQSLTAAG